MSLASLQLLAVRACALALLLCCLRVDGTAYAASKPGPLVGRVAPRLVLDGLDGRRFSVEQALGRYVLMIFSDSKSRLDARAFLAHHAARFGSVRGLSVFNILVPSQILIPRATWLHQARSDAARSHAEARSGLMSHQESGFDEVEFRWHADFNRSVSDLFDAPRGLVSLLLIDPNGYIVVQEPDSDEPAVQRVMKAMKEKRLAPGSKPPQVRTPDSALQAATAARHETAARLGVQARPRLRDPDDESEAEDAPPVSENPPPEGRDDGAAVGVAPPPKGTSRKKNRFLY